MKEIGLTFINTQNDNVLGKVSHQMQDKIRKDQLTASLRTQILAIPIQHQDPAERSVLK